MKSLTVALLGVVLMGGSALAQPVPYGHYYCAQHAQYCNHPQYVAPQGLGYGWSTPAQNNSCNSSYSAPIYNPSCNPYPVYQQSYRQGCNQNNSGNNWNRGGKRRLWQHQNHANGSGYYRCNLHQQVCNHH